MPSALPAVKAQLVTTTLPALFPEPVLVSYGPPGPRQPDVIIGVGNAEVQIERPTASPSRPREEVFTLEVIFSVFSGGDETVQQAVTELAFTLLGTFADFFKTRPNETLGGTCREAWVSSYVLEESAAFAPPEDGGGVSGRVAEITSVLTVKSRI
jgi:hypothetical protein